MPDYVIVDKSNEVVAAGDSKAEALEFLEQFRLQGGDGYRLLERNKPTKD